MPDPDPFPTTAALLHSETAPLRDDGRATSFESRPKTEVKRSTQQSLAPTSRVNIREGLRSDAQRLHEIELATFDVHQIPLRAFQRLMGKPSALTLVCEKFRAEQAPLVVGYARVLFRQGARCARLYSLAVAEEARNLGIGSRLISAAIEQVRDKGLDVLTLEVRSKDIAARRLYERFGFALKAELPVYYDDGADAVRLTLSLR